QRVAAGAAGDGRGVAAAGQRGGPAGETDDTVGPGQGRAVRGVDLGDDGLELVAERGGDGVAREGVAGDGDRVRGRRAGADRQAGGGGVEVAVVGQVQERAGRARRVQGAGEQHAAGVGVAGGDGVGRAGVRRRDTGGSAVGAVAQQQGAAGDGAGVAGGRVEGGEGAGRGCRSDGTHDQHPYE